MFGGGGGALPTATPGAIPGMRGVTPTAIGMGGCDGVTLGCGGGGMATRDAGAVDDITSDALGSVLVLGPGVLVAEDDGVLEARLSLMMTNDMMLNSINMFALWMR